ncbi:MAG: PQQ-binding-like beta-propeller repeat protein [Phycisphaerae bacterium]
MLVGSSVVWAQQKQRKLQPVNPIAMPQRPAARRPMMPAQSARPVLIEPSAPIKNLLQKAEEGISRRDWKFAIDSLQRIIEHPERPLVERSRDADGRVYESVRRVALARLASLPPEALRAYRLLFDGKARGLLQRGRMEHDPDALRVVVDRYLLSRYGDDAAQLLASWMLDAGRPADALALLTELAELVRDADVSQVRTDLIRASCLALLGRSNEAVAMFEPDGRAEQLARAVGLDWSEIETALVGLARSESAPGDASGGRAGWLTVGGSPAHLGRMAATSPTLHGRTPWHYPFGRVGVPSQDSIGAPASENGFYPTPSVLVAVNDLIFVRTPELLAALDADSLNPVWSRDFALRVPRDPTRRAGEPVVLPGEMEAATTDHAGWSVSAGQGLLYVLQRGKVRLGGSAVARRGSAPNRVLGSLPTWLTAVDQRTGAVRWQRGRTEAFPDPLADVEFRATPILAEGELWIPFQRQRDLYMAVLEPDTGALIHSSLLCTLPSPGAPLWGPLQPACGDGVVYIPTGEGVLLAVDQKRHALRWANQYAGSVSDASGLLPESPAHRLVSPPVVAGGRVFLAPVGRDEVLAFSATNGELLWRVPIGGSAHIVAWDSGYLWLGGGELACLLAADGQRVWTKTIEGLPTGRTVLAGDVLYTPTWDALVSVDALTGQRLRVEPLPEQHNPLGNLFCVNDSMYALDSRGLKRFPDVGRAFPHAAAEYAKHPDSLHAAVNLGWMELLRDRPDEAYQVCQDHDIKRSEEAASDDLQDLKRLKMEALLALAKQDSHAPAQRIAYLKEAGASARNAQEQLRCGMALAETLEGLGRVDKAYRHLLALGMNADTATAATRSGAVRASARLQIRHRLRELEATLPDAQRRAIESEVRGVISQATRALEADPRDREAIETLLAVVALNPLGRGTTDARFELSDWYAVDQRYEQAEQYLLAGSRSATGSDAVITALMRQYEQYDALFGGHPSAQRDLLKTLAERFGAAPLPGETGRTVQAWVDARRADLARFSSNSGVDAAAEGVAQGLPGFTGNMVWPAILADVQPNPAVPVQRMPVRPNGDAMIAFSGVRDPALADRVLTLGAGDLLRCFRLADGQLLWKTQMGVSKRPGTVSQASVMRGGLAPYDAVAAGQTAVILGNDGLHAIGLLTGKRIWSIPYIHVATPGSLTREGVEMAMGDGFIVATPHGGWLTKASLIDGSTIWERDLRGEKVASIKVVGQTIVLADPRQERIHLLRADDGTLIQLALFRQPDHDSGLINIVISDATVCGAVASTTGDRVVARSLETGAVVWEKECPKPVGQLFAPKDNVVGVSLLGGDILLIEADSGETLFAGNVTATHKRIVDAVQVDDRLILRHHTPKLRSVSLTALDLTDGKVAWVRGGLARLDAVRYDLEAVDGTVVILTRTQVVRGRSGALKAVMLDVDTGEDVGVEMDLRYIARRGLRLVEIQRHESMVLIATPEAVLPAQVGVFAKKTGDS